MGQYASFWDKIQRFTGTGGLPPWLKDVKPEKGSFAEMLSRDIDKALKALRKPSSALPPPGGPDLTAQTAALTVKLREQAEVFGLTSRQAEIYKLQMKGATAEQLGTARALDRQMTAMEQILSGTAAGANAYDQYRTRVDELNEALGRHIITQKEAKNVYTGLLEQLRKADMAKAAKLWEDALTPLQKFNAELDDLSRLALQGTIGVQLEASGAMKAFESLRSGIGDMTAKAPAALTKGSKEALSVIRESERADKDTVQNQIHRVLINSEEIQKKQVEATQKVYDELRQRGMVKGAAINF
jgi:hypothetical protein